MNKKKLINWLFLLLILTVILFGVKWADNKRDQWLDKHQSDNPAEINANE